MAAERLKTYLSFGIVGPQIDQRADAPDASSSLCEGGQRKADEPESKRSTSHLPHLSTRRALFDYLVGLSEERGWDLSSQRGRGFHVDHELEPCRLFHRQV